MNDAALPPAGEQIVPNGLVCQPSSNQVRAHVEPDANITAN